MVLSNPGDNARQYLLGTLLDMRWKRPVRVLISHLMCCSGQQESPWNGMATPTP